MVRFCFLIAQIFLVCIQYIRQPKDKVVPFFKNCLELVGLHSHSLSHTSFVRVTARSQHDLEDWRDWPWHGEIRDTGPQLCSTKSPKDGSREVSWWDSTPPDPNGTITGEHQWDQWDHGTFRNLQPAISKTPHQLVDFPVIYHIIALYYKLPILFTSYPPFSDKPRSSVFVGRFFLPSDGPYNGLQRLPTQDLLKSTRESKKRMCSIPEWPSKSKKVTNHINHRYHRFVWRRRPVDPPGTPSSWKWPWPSMLERSCLWPEPHLWPGPSMAPVAKKSFNQVY